jgi:hypothetical protein
MAVLSHFLATKHFLMWVATSEVAVNIVCLIVWQPKLQHSLKLGV